MPTETHDFMYEQSFLSDDVTPWCSCGWSGAECPDKDAAVDAWENHCEQVFMEATGG